MDIYIEIADAINKEISEILHAAINRRTADYPCIRWNNIEVKIHKAVYRGLCTDDPLPTPCTCKTVIFHKGYICRDCHKAIEEA